MKNIVIFALFPLFSGAQEKAGRFKIKGYLKNEPANINWVYFGYTTDGQRKKDSVKLKDGKYRFAGNLTEPVIGNIWVRYAPQPDGTVRLLNLAFGH